MQRYLCPSCNAVTEAPISRFVWCIRCSQPLTVEQLMLVEISILPSEEEPQPPAATGAAT